MLTLEPFSEDQGRSAVHPARGIPPISFLAPCGFTHPLTRTHVRLLGPCFKTGRMGCPQAGVGSTQVTTATTYSVTIGNFHLLLQFFAAFNVNLVLTVYFQGRTGTPFVVPSTSNESDDSDPTELNNQDNGVMLLRSTEAKNIKDSVKASLLEVFKPRALVNLAAAESSTLLMNEPQWVDSYAIEMEKYGLEDKNNASVVKEITKLTLKNCSIELPD
ncbi:hypothetical protein L2E82_40144 [Cichorium intybus]|uniref:Uncharacterized protein n=1 Tax=Cichorium intybus TaxID=13427 RepID=A0ACB9APK3_CICIN|nr:hypothetical protein L2E82_40144 [Cichorium intybus]